MQPRSFSIELKKVDKRLGYQVGYSQWEYTRNVQSAEHIANKWSAKKGRKYTYYANVTEMDGYRMIGTSMYGAMQYTKWWIDTTAVSATVDGQKYTVTLESN